MRFDALTSRSTVRSPAAVAVVAGARLVASSRRRRAVPVRPRRPGIGRRRRVPPADAGARLRLAARPRGQRRRARRASRSSDPARRSTSSCSASAASRPTPRDVLGVVANITVVEPTSTGYLNAYGKDAPAGTAAIINFVAGQTVPNLAIVRPGTDGKLTIKLAAGTGTAHVVVDVFGWFSTEREHRPRPAPASSPVTPGRILDTRTGLNRAAGRTPLDRRRVHRPSRSAASMRSSRPPSTSSRTRRTSSASCSTWPASTTSPAARTRTSR